MRTVFIGTSEFAAAVLERIAAGEHRPQLVLTRPDRPRGRGRKLASPPVAGTALQLGIALAQPADINEDQAREQIARARPDAVVVCAFGALIREPLLSEYELLNVHPSLLPRWRGAAPVEWAIMAGDTRTGVSIMRLTAGLDSGPVCMAREIAIEPHDTYGTLAARLQALGGELIVGVLDQIGRGQAPAFVQQDEAGATYAEKIAPEDRLLDPRRSALELERVVRALHPHIGARISLHDGTMLGVHSAAALSAATAAPGGSSVAPGGVAVSGELGVSTEPSVAPGELGMRGGRLVYGTVDGTLELLVVQPPGGRAMDAQAYMRGHATRRHAR